MDLSVHYLCLIKFRENLKQQHIFMSQKLSVGILFGGKSTEHEVSLQSAKSIVDAIDKEKYDVVLIGIDKTGRWMLQDKAQYLLNADNPKFIALNKQNQKEVVVTSRGDSTSLVSLGDQSQTPIDVVFPVLHGPMGEDGTVQGLLKLMNIPFVGAGVLGSAIGMDKDVMKRLLRDAGVPIAKFITVRRNQVLSYDEIILQLGTVIFVKPANAGSSVGVSKVRNKEEFLKAIEEAFRYDSKVLIEESIIGREVECSVLGNEHPIASVPGEVIPTHEFYSYEAKYIDENGAKLTIPAELPDSVAKRVQEIAIKAFQTLECEGMARVDCFMKENGDVLINEINTIPGFTKISMYPKLWEASGITYPELIDSLIQLALARFEREKSLQATL